MRTLSRPAAALVLVFAAACSSPPPTERLPEPDDPRALRDVEGFSSIRDRRERSIALFEEAGKVLQHPRCVNCHPAGDRPMQTDGMRPHIPLVVRGKDGHGAPGLRCDTCHHAANFDAARVPGHPLWHLAPLEMAWQGRTLGQICEQIKDPARNGGKDMNALLHHMAEDSLVGWGWAPGAGRTPAPGTQAQFGALLRAWADTGAHCPASDASRRAAGP
jgi:hypothetical protein